MSILFFRPAAAGPAPAATAPAAIANVSDTPTVPPVQRHQELPQGSGSSKSESDGGEKTADSNANADTLREREKTALESLGAAISRVEDPFFCSGEVPVPGPSSDASKITLRLKHRHTPTTVPLTVPAPFYYKEPEKGPSWRHCSYDPFQFDHRAAKKKLDSTPLTPEARAAFRAFEVSPFGHGGETVVDESVRKAMQVNGFLSCAWCHG